MSTDTVRSQLAQLAKKRAGLETDRAKHLKAAAAAAEAAAAKTRQAQKSSSPTTQRSYANAAAVQNKKHAEESRKSGEIAAKIADLDKQIAAKSRTLATEEESERRKADRLRKADDASAEKRRKLEKAHAVEMARLGRTEIRHVIVEPPKPEMLRVLYMTSSPDLDRPLRVDAEVNAVQRAIMSARHRLSMQVSYAPAVTPQDFFDRLNFERPHVLHFSGHGDDRALLFDNASVAEPAAAPVGFDVLAAFLSATESPPRLLLMNACKSLAGVDLLLEAVPIVIGITDEIEDGAAAIFAVQFYSAIANGQPVGHAFRQGQTAIRHNLLSDEQADLPVLAHRADIDPNSVRLVASQSD